MQWKLKDITNHSNFLGRFSALMVGTFLSHPQILVSKGHTSQDECTVGDDWSPRLSGHRPRLITIIPFQPTYVQDQKVCWAKTDITC